MDTTEDPTQAPRVRVLLEELLMSLQQCESDLGIYPPSPFDLEEGAVECCILQRQDPFAQILSSFYPIGVIWYLPETPSNSW